MAELSKSEELFEGLQQGEIVKVGFQQPQFAVSSQASKLPELKET
jgi:hypothetical protein